jgi:hypothetical protein
MRSLLIAGHGYFSVIAVRALYRLAPPRRGTGCTMTLPVSVVAWG